MKKLTLLVLTLSLPGIFVACKEKQAVADEENVIHASLISMEKEYVHCIQLIHSFLPYVDNWAICDGIAPTPEGEAPARKRRKHPSPSTFRPISISCVV